MLATAAWGQEELSAAIPCRFDELASEMDALLDTGAPFCVMRADVASELHLNPESGDPVKIRRGLTLYTGVLHRHPVRVPALKGQDLYAEPTWFVSEEWDGPIVFGWVGFLESLEAFGCKPGIHSGDQSLFCFSPA